MDEFALIRRHFAGLTASRDDVALGIGDDAALLLPPPGEQLVVSTDTLVAGRHFPHDTAAFSVGWKALAVNLSDLAAMGATPRWFTLALTLPEAEDAWLAQFAAGLGALAARHGVALVGGDTTRGSLSLTLTVIGGVPTGRALRRDGAHAGDLLAVTGTLGDAALALAQLLGDEDAHAAPGQESPLRRRLERPEPRVEAGIALRGLATAALDLSDGLASDLRHLCTASGVGAELEPLKLPQSTAFAAEALPAARRFALQARGGDDYELCVALPPAALDEARARLAALQPPVPLTVIGRCVTGDGIALYHADGRREPLLGGGYDHFATAAPLTDATAIDPTGTTSP